MLYPISQNVPVCPKCKAKLEKVYRYGHIFFNCNDCNTLLQVVRIGQAEIELMCTDTFGEMYEEELSLPILSQIKKENSIIEKAKKEFSSSCFLDQGITQGIV